MIHELKSCRFITRNSNFPPGADLVEFMEILDAQEQNNRLVALRDSLLSLADKYPSHARSIAQLASSVEMLLHLPFVKCL